MRYFILTLILICTSLNASAASTMKMISGPQLIAYFLKGQAVTSEMKMSLERHLRDSNKNYPDPVAMRKATLPAGRVISGSNYLVTPFFPWKYKFETADDHGTLVIKIRIHFKSGQAYQIAELTQKVAEAQEIWNSNAPTDLVNFPYRFQFEVVKNPKNAMISVGILDKTRGPFYKNWSMEWTTLGVAHEIGHMMGLSDEYDELSGDSGQCLHYSVMCFGWYNSEPLSFHYYHILRRTLK